MQYNIGKRLGVILGIVILILLIPFIAMQFDNGSSWSVFDFVLAGVVLFVIGSVIDLAIQKAGKYKVWVIAAIVLVFLWLWVELAVGLFTNWGS